MVVPSKQSSGRLDEDLGFAECRGLKYLEYFFWGGGGGFLIMVLLELVYPPPQKKKKTIQIIEAPTL